MALNVRDEVRRCSRRSHSTSVADIFGKRLKRIERWDPKWSEVAQVAGQDCVAPDSRRRSDRKVS